MTLIKSISGIRGTIGGGAGEGLNPLDIVKFTSAYATLIRKTCTVKSNKIVVGRDARISGEMVKNVVVGTLMGMGWDVVDIDLASTPTTELAVTMEGASGGIILTASAQEKPSIAEVVAVGPGGNVDGKDIVMNVKVGDRVLISKYAGTEVKVDGVEYSILRQSDILAVVE